MISGLDRHFRGHYSLSFSGGTLPRSLAYTPISNILGESISLTSASGNTAGNNKGNTTDQFIIHGLYITNSTDEAFTHQTYFDYATTIANYAVIPPMSTVYMVTADNPIIWNGSAFRSTLNGRSGYSLAGDSVSLHMVYSAILKD